jgi:hypothetical protein
MLNAPTASGGKADVDPIAAYQIYEYKPLDVMGFVPIPRWGNFRLSWTRIIAEAYLLCWIKRGHRQCLDPVSDNSFRCAQCGEEFDL